ncbi:MAG TPA: hypothetical protein VK817_01060 [Trebonia sp.]|nr:hypothetical protein [Trebonia sp.]
MAPESQSDWSDGANELFGGVPLFRFVDHCSERILEDVRVSAPEQHQSVPVRIRLIRVRGF